MRLPLFFIMYKSLNFLTIDTPSRPVNGGEFTISKSGSTSEIDKIIHHFGYGEYGLLRVYCKLLGINVPCITDEIVNIVLKAEMTQLGWWLSRDISTKFPDKSLEYYDFSEEEKEENQFCTDNGRVLWTSKIEKGDLIITCESRNR